MLEGKRLREEVEDEWEGRGSGPLAKRARVARSRLRHGGRPPMMPGSARKKRGLCLTPVRVQGWRLVGELERLDDRELISMVLEIERRYHKLMTFEREEIDRARSLGLVGVRVGVQSGVAVEVGSL